MTTTTFLAEVDEAIEVYEDAIGNFASRTRQMISEQGAVAALSKLVQSPNLQSGFRVLRDRGELDRTFEAVVLRHQSLFDHPIVEAARWRIDNADQLR